MPLDTGTLAPELFSSPGTLSAVADMTAPVQTLALQEGAHVGEGLRAAREALGLSLQDVADGTRIRRAYLAALEAMQLDQLPSRPFAIGYVRAYARVLRIDEDLVLERFKRDAPADDEPLREPVGVSSERDPRLVLIAVGAAFVLGAIIVWNVAKRSMADRAPPPPPPMAAVPSAAPPPGPVTLGQALPAPAESTIPAPYVTPGLENGSPGADGAMPATPAAKAASGPLPEAPLLYPNAATYGAAANESIVSLRARKAVSIVANGVGGQPVFARVLSPGETYRVPLSGIATLDVSDPTAVDVYNQGQFMGQLPQPITPVSRLGG